MTIAPAPAMGMAMNTLQTTTPARLHHLHLTSTDPERLIRFYARMLGYSSSRLEDGTYVLSGGQRNLLISEGRGGSTSFVGFTLNDAGVLRRHTGVRDLRQGDERRRIARGFFIRSDHEHHSLAFFLGSKNELDHHAYETSCWNDIRDWGDRFGRERISMFWGPGRHGPGDNLFFMVRDPDGNKVELSAELETMAPDQEPRIWPNTEYTLNYWGSAWMRS